ncbi:hypothetical protein COX74_03155 [bacterium (Candidatus Gribaldobacteria) CG_4_10_14_0_2_um_filter_41_16]|uniref:TIGR00374 family protein n=1 Tax=bacterium (Candidatus Gribaldobacteria) CG_4_10_14_0_2_um_filter_41_16 TaxID=2014265 RepID=A0A2M7VHR4_9BACT|nr:MAG: hypothetical protein AUJ11_02130 [Parcubacteria group bacterium CG1_02_44_65]PJA01353.1 MAG: hypothetical protein COX74_03155 [bacterium (Candidatus Gribaldobacteria) CG_4_10_14_0_2_um_filter_41_16]
MALNKSNQAKLIKLSLLALGMILLFFLINRAGGFFEIVAIITKAKFNFIVYGFLVYLLLILTRAYKWFLLIRAGGVKIKYQSFLPFYLANCLISNISPFKSGEAATPLIFKKYLKIPVGQGFSVVILDRFFELVFFTLIFILAIIYIMKSAVAGELVLSIFKWALVGFVLLTAFLIGIISSKKFSLEILAIFKRFEKYPIINKILEFIKKELEIFYESLKLYKNKGIYKFMIPLTLISWFFEFFSFYLIFSSIMPASFLRIASAQILAIAATLVTFIPGGIGIGELGVVYILNLFYYPAALTTAAVLLARLILTGTLLASGIAGSFLLKEKAE